MKLKKICLLPVCCIILCSCFVKTQSDGNENTNANLNLETGKNENSDETEKSHIDSTEFEFLSRGLEFDKYEELEGCVATGIKCKKKQGKTFTFDVYIGHLPKFCDILPETFFEDNHASSFALIQNNYDINFNLKSSNICCTLELFESDEYDFYFKITDKAIVYNYRHFETISNDINNLTSEDGLISFEMILLDKDGNQINNFDRSFGIDGFAKVYYKIDNESIEFFENKGE